MNARFLIVAGLVAAGGFAVGRHLARSQAAAAADSGAADSATSERRDTSPGVRARQATADMPTLDDGEVVLGRRFDSRWVRLVEADRRGATELRQTVLHALEARRRSADEIRRCFPKDAVGAISVRFQVDVASHNDRVRIGRATFMEVQDGFPLSKQHIHCLETAFDGTADLPRAPEVHPAYTGEIDYVAQFYFPPNND